MKILIVFRKKEGTHWENVKSVEKKLISFGHTVDLLSREDDLNMPSLSNSMGGLPSAIEKKDKEKKYDIVYTQDWSIALPLLFPTKTLFEKHYSFFHDVEPSGAQSKILQKIAGNILGEKLVVRTNELKEKFPKSRLSPDGIIEEMRK